MGGRDRKPRPHAISTTDEILHHLLDEVERIGDRLERAFPDPAPPPEREEPPAEATAVTVPIEEPEPAPARRPAKKATKKVTG